MRSTNGLGAAAADGQNQASAADSLDANTPGADQLFLHAQGEGSRGAATQGAGSHGASSSASAPQAASPAHAPQGAAPSASAPRGATCPPSASEGDSPQEFYGDYYQRLLEAQRQLDTLVNDYIAARSDSDDLKPVVYHSSRIKSPESLQGKLRRLGAKPTFETALSLQIHDIVGARVICAFIDDVYDAADYICGRPEVWVQQRKDYIANPKPNGYRSLHLIVRLTQGPAADLLPLEIQLRTIAIDFWATLEHKIKYKKTIANEELIRAELKRCADEITSVDLSMQSIRNAIRSADQE